jgi:ribosomal protein L29
MAEKTTKAKAAPKAELTLQQQLTAKRSDLFDAKKSLASGELVNPRIIGTIRKDIARLLTTINAQKEAK